MSTTETADVTIVRPIFPKDFKPECDILTGIVLPDDLPVTGSIKFTSRVPATTPAAQSAVRRTSNEAIRYAMESGEFFSNGAHLGSIVVNGVMLSCVFPTEIDNVSYAGKECVIHWSGTVVAVVSDSRLRNFIDSFADPRAQWVMDQVPDATLKNAILLAAHHKKEDVDA